MSLKIVGMGWVTPLGSGIDFVWERLVAGDESTAGQIGESFSDQSYSVFRVPDTALTQLTPHPRLRRASAISRFAAAAGLQALNDAGIKLDPETSKRVALVFAVSNGGVIYTKRFYRGIVESGAQSASPLLFPETVFNAPASHLAAILEITGLTYTLVGDSAVGLVAMRMAEDLMLNKDLDYCVVVGAEEVDWVLCDAYRKWRLLRLQPPIEPFNKVVRGTVLSEGAGAVVLAREGPIEIASTHPGGHYHKRDEAEAVLNRIVAELAPIDTDVVIASANGTFIDEMESKIISKRIPNSHVYSSKPALGEGVGAAGLWQVILGAKVLLTRELPPSLHVDPACRLRVSTSRQSISTVQNVVSLTCGLNQQIAGIRLQTARS